MEGTQSFQFWSIFGPNLSPENEKYWEKTKFSQKLHRQQYLITQIPAPR